MLKFVMIVLLYSSGPLQFTGFDSFESCQKAIPDVVRQLEYKGKEQVGPRLFMTHDAYCMYYKVSP